jgi:hypothetical protein
MGTSQSSEPGAHRSAPSVPGGRWERAAYRVGWYAARTWTRANRYARWRPQYAWWLARQVTSGHYSPSDAWWFWRCYPRSQRDSRRRADAARRVRRMDGSTTAVAIAGGRLSRSPYRTFRGRLRPRWAVAPDAHPRWVTRRFRTAWWIKAAVAEGSIRAAAVPDAWRVASAASDGIDPFTPARGRHSHTVPNESRR